MLPSEFVFLKKNLRSLTKMIPNTNFSSQNLIDPRQESYARTARRYLDHIISIIASYALLITFWATLLYTIPEIEAYAITADSPTTTTTPEPDQVDIRPVRLATRAPCPYPQMGSRATDIRLCYEQNESSCTIL